MNWILKNIFYYNPGCLYCRWFCHKSRKCHHDKNIEVYGGTTDSTMYNLKSDTLHKKWNKKKNCTHYHRGSNQTSVNTKINTAENFAKEK